MEEKKQRRGPRGTILGGLKAISPAQPTDKLDEAAHSSSTPDDDVVSDILSVQLDNYVPGVGPVRTGSTIRLGTSDTVALRKRIQEGQLRTLMPSEPSRPAVRASTEAISIPRLEPLRTSRSLEEPAPYVPRDSEVEVLEPFAESLLNTEMRVWPWAVLVFAMLVGLFYMISTGH